MSERNDEIIWRVLEGETFQSVADSYGISRQRVGKIVSEAGIKVGKRYGHEEPQWKDPADYEKVAKAYKNGLSLNQCRLQFHISYKVLYRILGHWGVEIRPRGGRVVR